MDSLPSPDQCRAFLNVAHQAALEAGKVLNHYWNRTIQVSTKTTPWDLVTQVDHEAEKVILSIIEDAYPDHAIVAEESGSSERTHDFRWAVDPVDGTTNYTHRYPLVSTSIGLLFRGKPLVGVVFNPIFNELFMGAHGLGATLNGQPLRVSAVDKLEQSLLASGFAYDRLTAKATNYNEFCRMTHITQGVRRGGSAAIDLAYVAAGRLEGYWERGLKIWDLAAGVVLIEEAGGKVTNYDNSPLNVELGSVLATNTKIHNQLSQELLALKDLPQAHIPGY